MLEENRKILEQNCLLITKFENEINDYKQAILEELQKEKIYKIVLDRKSEKQHNKRLKHIALSNLILFMIPFNHFRQIIPSIDFVNDYIAFILVVVFMMGLSSCGVCASIKSLIALKHLIESGVIAYDEVEKILLLDNDYINNMIEEIPHNIEKMKNELAELEEMISWIIEYNTRLRKLNKLEEKVLNDKLIKEELENEFNKFLDEYTNPINIHFNTELEKPLKLIFTNK